MILMNMDWDELEWNRIEWPILSRLHPILEKKGQIEESEEREGFWLDERVKALWILEDSRWRFGDGTKREEETTTMILRT